MPLSLADIERWDPEEINEVAKAAAARARTSREAARELTNLPVFETWEGEAAEAARGALQRRSAKLELSAVEAFTVAVGAGHAYQEAQSVKSQVRQILADAATAPAVEINLSTNSVIPPDTSGWASADVAALAAKIEDLQNRIVAVLALAEETDADLARVLTTATGGQGVNPGEQGASDGRSLQDGQLTAQESARLAENTTLSPQQLSALARGELVLSESQMQYLYEFSRSLDGKSPAEIRDLMNRLGPQGGHVADALQLVSNEHVSAAGVNTALKPGQAGYVPARGSFDALPSELRRTLTAYPLEWQKTNVAPGVYPQARQELNDLAGIVSKGNPALQQGSTLDAHLLHQADTMLSESRVPAELLPFTKGQVDPTLQSMLSAAGRDPIAVHDALAGVDGRTPNKEFIGNLLSHQWADNGAAAGSLLHGTTPIANPTDLTDPTQLRQAVIAGETMHAVDSYAGANANDLLNLPGAENQSLGQVNPELTRALAEANKPFIDDMLGNALDNTRGFEPLDKLTDPEMPMTRDLFAVVDTDGQAAASLNSEAYLDGMRYQAGFEQSVVDGRGLDGADLQSAGTLRGVIDTAANIADNDAIQYGNIQDVKAFESRGQWFDIAKSLGDQIPGLNQILDSAGSLPGDPLHDIFVGDAPTPADLTHIATQSSEALQHSVAQHLLNNNLGDASLFANLIDPATGQLQPLNDRTFATFRSAFLQYFEGIDPTFATAIENYEDAYRDALPTSPGHIGK